MIQRKQTLYLLAALLLVVFSFFFPIARYQAPDGSVDYSLHTRAIQDEVAGGEVVDAPLKYPIYLVYGLLGAMLLVDIFLFKNRKRQLTILRSGYVFAAFIIVLQLITHASASAYLGKGRDLDTAYGITMFLPVGILVCMYLADRGIQADEQLVKSMDRLR